MGMLSSYTVYAPIEQNVEMKVRLVGVVERPNEHYGEDGHKSKDLQGFVDFAWERADGRPLRDSRTFPLGVNILVEQLLSQNADLPTQVGLDVLVKHIIDNKTEFSCWATVNAGEDTEYRNFVFRQPEVKVSQREAGLATEAEPKAPARRGRKVLG